MSEPPPLPRPSPRPSFWWKCWIAAVLAVPMVGVGTMWSGEKTQSDVLVVAAFGLTLLVLVFHIIASIKLANAIEADRALRGRSSTVAGLIIGLLFGGWAVMFALFFCGCLATMMTIH